MIVPVDSTLVGRIVRLRGHAGRPPGWGKVVALLRGDQDDVVVDVLRAFPYGGRYFYPRDRVVLVRKVPVSVHFPAEAPSRRR